MGTRVRCGGSASSLRTSHSPGGLQQHARGLRREGFIEAAPLHAPSPVRPLPDSCHLSCQLALGGPLCLARIPCAAAARALGPHVVAGEGVWVGWGGGCACVLGAARRPCAVCLAAAAASATAVATSTLASGASTATAAAFATADTLSPTPTAGGSTTACSWRSWPTASAWRRRWLYFSFTTYYGSTYYGCTYHGSTYQDPLQRDAYRVEVLGYIDLVFMVLFSVEAYIARLTSGTALPAGRAEQAAVPAAARAATHRSRAPPAPTPAPPPRLPRPSLGP